MQTATIHKFPDRTRPREFFAHSGWVYVFGNGLMPNIYKIGRTAGSVQARMAQLYTTGVPMPFDCMFAEWFANCHAAERFIHARLEDTRIELGREFFEADLREIEYAFMEYSAIGEDVPDDIVDIYSQRRNDAESVERVKGGLVARGANRTSSPKVPF